MCKEAFIERLMEEAGIGRKTAETVWLAGARFEQNQGQPVQGKPICAANLEWMTMCKEDMVSLPRELAETFERSKSPPPAWAVERLRAILDAQAEQRQGEPLALPKYLDTEQMDGYQSPYNRGWNACLDEIAKLGPLYAHADPGKVERMRKELEIALSDIKVEQRVSHNLRQHKTDYMEAAVETRKALLAQLAERDALLREWGELSKRGIGSQELHTRTVAALSASAEPKSLVCKTCDGHGAVGNMLNAEPCPDCCYRKEP